MDTKARENRLRRQADRLGYLVRKDRARSWGLEHRGEYMLLDVDNNIPVVGWNYDYSLDDVEEFLADEEVRLRGVTA